MKRVFFLSLLLVVVLCVMTGCFGGSSEQDGENGEGNSDVLTAEQIIEGYSVYSFEGHYYGILGLGREVTWEEASLMAETFGAHLVTITSAEENSFVAKLVQTYDLDVDSMAFGAYKKGDVWTWITGEAFDYTNFAPGEPNGNGPYGWFYTNRHKRAYQWDDAGNGTTKYFICEWEKKEDIGHPVYYHTSKVDSVDGLRALANSSNTFALVADIDLSAAGNWTPIEGFTGTLIGDGHRISNLTIDSMNEANIGLFGTLEGTVKDLTIENAQITARGDAGNAGILAGTLKNGTISNVTVSGTIAPEYYSNVGGVVGYSSGGIVTDCTNQATVLGADSVGGIAGYMVVDDQEALSNCVNEGAVTGKENVGGIAGYLTCVTSNETWQISKHTNKNNVNGTSDVGGVFGEVYAFYKYQSYRDYNSYFSMTQLTNTAEITGSATGSCTGGLVGRATRLSTMRLCENKADITGGYFVGGIAGLAPDTNIKADGIKNNNTITGKGVIGGFAGQGGLIENAVNNGEIVLTGVYVEDGLNTAYIGGIAGCCTGLVGCTNNVDIKISSNSLYVGGLSGKVTVSDQNRVNNNINHGEVVGADKVGGIAGYLTCTTSNATYQLSNNENRGAVTGNSFVGGIFGEVYAFYKYQSYHDYNSYFSISVLTNSGEVKGSNIGEAVGGLIGKATRLTMLNACQNNADVTGGAYVGGFVGYAPDTNVKATGAANNNTITGGCFVGGIAGWTGVIEDAVNNGTVVAKGVNAAGETCLGGIAGYCTGVRNCVNNSDITGPDGGMYVGGIVGCVKVYDTNRVNGNTNNGVITGCDNVGGIAGCLTKESNSTWTVSDNANRNKVNGNVNVGGIFGRVDGKAATFEVINSSNADEISGTSYFGGIVGYNIGMKIDENLMSTNTTTYGEKIGTEVILPPEETEEQ